MTHTTVIGTPPGLTQECAEGSATAHRSRCALRRNTSVGASPAAIPPTPRFGRISEEDLPQPLALAECKNNQVQYVVHV